MKNIIFEYKEGTGERRNFEVEPLALSKSGEDWALKAFDVKKGGEKSFLFKNICRVFDESLQRFFCVTVYVVSKDRKFLMLLNKKLGRWVPPGGKIDAHEIPEEAAVRECFEETGVRIKLIGEKAPVESGLISPYGVQLNTITPGQRDHIDLIYLGYPVGSEALAISEREALDIGWFSYEEVLKLDTFPSVYDWCRFFNAL